jgi:hypothetical protein
VTIVGDCPIATDFQQTGITVSGADLVLTNAVSDSTLPSIVRFIDPLTFTWKATLNGKDTPAGTSRHQVYVVFKNPQPYQSRGTVPAGVLLTLLHLSTTNAHGADDASTDQAVVDKIYADFTDRVVQRFDGTQLTYWGTGVPPQVLEGLLEQARGSCIAWAELFHNAIRTQGITGSERTLIVPRAPAKEFMVKKWTFTGAGSAPHLAPYSYLADVDLTNEQGDPGQGNPNPPGNFVLHHVVKYGSRYYDPSYGSGPFANEDDWENRCLDGFLTQTSTGVWVAKKKQLDVPGTLFVPIP